MDDFLASVRRVPWWAWWTFAVVAAMGAWLARRLSLTPVWELALWLAAACIAAMVVSMTAPDDTDATAAEDDDDWGA